MKYVILKDNNNISIISRVLFVYNITDKNYIITFNNYSSEKLNWYYNKPQLLNNARNYWNMRIKWGFLPEKDVSFSPYDVLINNKGAFLSSDIIKENNEKRFLKWLT